jgi:hypothetical protein
MTRFLRLWLLRLIYEQRDLAGSGSAAAVPSAAATAAPAAVSADAHAGEA